MEKLIVILVPAGILFVYCLYKLVVHLKETDTQYPDDYDNRDCYDDADDYNHYEE